MPVARKQSPPNLLKSVTFINYPQFSEAKVNVWKILQ